MMSELQRRLRANFHRRQCEAAIREARPALSAILDSAPCIMGAEADAWVQTIPWPHFIDGRQTTIAGDIDGSAFWECDERSTLLKLMNRLEPGDVAARLFLDRSGPIWSVSLGKFPELVEDLLEFARTHQFCNFAWIAEDFGQGVVYASYHGLLPEGKRTNFEHRIVYEILHWGVQALD